MKWLAIISFIVSAGRVLGDEPPATLPKTVEFVGYVRMVDSDLISLYDDSTRECSPWMKRGQTWRGYMFKSLDADTDRLTLGVSDKEDILDLRKARILNAGNTPQVIENGFVTLDGTIVYNQNAKLVIGDSVITSPSGVMVSDKEQKIIAGNLNVQTGNLTVEFTDGVVDVAQRRYVGKNMHIQCKKPPVADEAKSATNTPIAEQNSK